MMMISTLTSSSERNSLRPAYTSSDKPRDTKSAFSLLKQETFEKCWANSPLRAAMNCPNNDFYSQQMRCCAAPQCNATHRNGVTENDR